MSMRIRWRAALAATMFCCVTAQQTAWAQAPEPAPNSPLDAQLFYQLLIGELELRQGQPGNAFEIILDAAQRTRSDQLYRRAVDIALHARSGDQALLAVRRWREAVSESQDALRAQLQILSAMNRFGELAEPLNALLALTPVAERSGLISVMPRFLQRAPDKRQAAAQLEEMLESASRDPGTRAAALTASGRAWLAADDAQRSLANARDAVAHDAAAVGPVLLAIELMGRSAEAERLVLHHLRGADVDPALRLAYVRALMSAQRYVDATAQLDRVTQERPDLPQPYLTLGAMHLELRHPQQADVALLRYLQLTDGAAAARSDSARDDDDEAEARPDQGRVQAWMMLAQSAEQRGDFAAAETWLARVDDPQRALEVQTRRATLLARQGRIADALDLVRRAPERERGDARAKLVAEAGVLREVKQWSEAYDVLGSAARSFPDDPDLLYEQAMVAEKMDRIDDMERLLRQVIAIKPDNAHAHNALGYSLADRSRRLPEARTLIRRALEISPGDPFITDSLGWVEYRMGNLEEALRLLRQAYSARPDVEIGAHLGEVLWAMGQRDEARRIWAESMRRDAANDVLRETLARLKVEL